MPRLHCKVIDKTSPDDIVAKIEGCALGHGVGRQTQCQVLPVQR